MTSNTISDDQLEYEQRLLGIPFLEEDLPFLANFDNRPWVSVDQVLDHLEAENSTNGSNSINGTNVTITATEAAPGTHSVDGAFNAPGVSYNGLNTNFVPRFTTAPRAEPDMGTFDAPDFHADELFAPNLPPRTNRTTTSSSSSSPFNTFPATATTHAATPDVGKFKKSCTICATRKIKCEVIPGSDPKLCKHCQEKGFACQFELKKAYGRA